MSDWNEEVRKALDLGEPMFRSLYDEHHQLETRVAELSEKLSLTLEEQFEEKRLKKKKLLVKDQMAEYLRSRTLSQSA